jgi:hypothetical protein
VTAESEHPSEEPSAPDPSAPEPEESPFPMPDIEKIQEGDEGDRD